MTLVTRRTALRGLVAAAVDGLLSRQIGVLVPTAIASGGLFAASGVLLWYVISFDARLRQWGRHD